MKILLQRVSRASVQVDGQIVARIGPGLLAFVGIARSDNPATVDRMAARTAGVRLFPDGDGRFDRSLQDTGGACLVVSQFTLLADARKGRRPSFVEAAPPERAAPLIERFAAALSALGIPTASGQFGAHMEVELVNDGPVTILLETPPLPPASAEAAS